MPRILHIISLFFLSTLSLMAQKHVNGSLSVDSAYTDLVQCDIDDQGLDLRVRVAFAEESNQVTISVASPRQLFAFYSMCRHRDVFKRWAGCRRLRISHLPASPLVEHRSSYRVKGHVVRKYKKPRRNHIYLPWLVTEHKKELTPSVRLLPDSLVETITVPADTRDVEFTLRNIMVAEYANGLPVNAPLPVTKKNGRGRKHYRFVAERDLQRTYHLTLLRDPCLYSGDAIAAAQQQLDVLKREWKVLLDTYGDKAPLSPAAHDILDKSKAYIALQHLAVSDTTDCSCLNALYAEYNTLLDSVNGLDCPIIEPANPENEKEALVGISPESILVQAHRIDSNVGRYLISSNPQERSDLVRECRKIIADTNMLINTNGVVGNEQRKAVLVFRKSVNYFRKICKH